MRRKPRAVPRKGLGNGVLVWVSDISERAHRRSRLLGGEAARLVRRVRGADRADRGGAAADVVARPRPEAGDGQFRLCPRGGKAATPDAWRAGSSWSKVGTRRAARGGRGGRATAGAGATAGVARNDRWRPAVRSGCRRAAADPPAGSPASRSTSRISNRRAAEQAVRGRAARDARPAVGGRRAVRPDRRRRSSVISRSGDVRDARRVACRPP